MSLFAITLAQCKECATVYKLSTDNLHVTKKKKALKDFFYNRTSL